jgi:hypothetical protein
LPNFFFFLIILLTPANSASWGLGLILSLPPPLSFLRTLRVPQCFLCI